MMIKNIWDGNVIHKGEHASSKKALYLDSRVVDEISLSHNFAKHLLLRQLFKNKLKHHLRMHSLHSLLFIHLAFRYINTASKGRNPIWVIIQAVCTLFCSPQQNIEVALVDGDSNPDLHIILHAIKNCHISFKNISRENHGNHVWT
jgi:hypothetical protein